MIVNGVYIPIVALIAACFCVFTAAKVVRYPTKFGMKVHYRTPRKQRKWKWLNRLCMVPMQKWLFTISLVFLATVIWDIMGMPYLGIAIIVRFASSLACNIMFAIILQKHWYWFTGGKIILLVSSVFSGIVWYGIFWLGVVIAACYL